MIKKQRPRTLIYILMAMLAIPSMAAASKTRVQGFAQGSQDPRLLNAGLSADDYGWHPDDDSSYGESWSMQAASDAGDFVYVLMSISNYHPLHKFGGTVDLFYYSASGEKYEAHQEFKSDQVRADKGRVMVDIGGNVFSGSRPTYRLKADLEGLGLDLVFETETADLRLGQGKILFGDKGERFWNLTVLGPRGRARGKVIANGREVPFEGEAYFDHGWSTIKLYNFSRTWYVIRTIQDDFSVNAVRMELRDGFEPDQAQAIYMTLGDKVIANSGSLELVPSGGTKHAASGLVIPESYTLRYQDGDTLLTGTVRMTRMIEGLNVLDRLSPVVRKVVQALVTDPWQFRFEGQADLVLEHNGQSRRITGPVIGEVHYYK